MAAWTVGREAWRSPTAEDPHGGAEIASLIDAVRTLQHRVTAARTPAPIATRLAEDLERISAELATYRSNEADRIIGRRTDLPGRGHPLLPPYQILSDDDGRIRGTVRFDDFYLGGNAAVHGGAQPLFFDDVMAKAAYHGLSGFARTAYLHVNYRQVTPVNEELDFRCLRYRLDGRKRWVNGQLCNRNGDVLCDADALFVELSSEQV